MSDPPDAPAPGPVPGPAPDPLPGPAPDPAPGPPARPPWRTGHRSAASRLLIDGNQALDARRAQLLATVDGRHAVLIEPRLGAGAGAQEALDRVQERYAAILAASGQPPVRVSGYLRCWLSPAEITALLAADAPHAPGAPGAASPAIYRIWPDYVLHPHLDQSVTTVSADAARRVYAATGQGIAWAVIDSGIEKDHPHFSDGTLTDPRVAGLHRDFTFLVTGNAEPPGPDPAAALADPVGHGTHVAGIIAGQLPADSQAIIAGTSPAADGLPDWTARRACGSGRIAGIAPQARLVSLRVLAPDPDNLDGATTVSSAVIAALAWVRKVNADGRILRIHGVNLSLGCPWYPDDFAAGQSPLCRELNLLVSTGVVAVVSAGNAGASGTTTGESADVAGVLSTITDPGNAAGAITVGSCHKAAPHVYGVTYTSSKGPTLDGRAKPDLVAPGEHIASAAAAVMCQGVGPLTGLAAGQVPYIEDSGTSMAAPHVSGAVAALLSVRREYIGQPEQVKQLLAGTASTLHRHEFYQGAGMIDLLRALADG